MCEDKEMEKYAQHMEIKLEDMDRVLRGLLNNGYNCHVWQDGESMDIVGIDYIRPEYDGHRFAEVEW